MLGRFRSNKLSLVTLGCLVIISGCQTTSELKEEFEQWRQEAVANEDKPKVIQSDSRAIGAPEAFFSWERNNVSLRFNVGDDLIELLDAFCSQLVNVLCQYDDSITSLSKESRRVTKPLRFSGTAQQAINEVTEVLNVGITTNEDAIAFSKTKLAIFDVPYLPGVYTSTLGGVQESHGTVSSGSGSGGGGGGGSGSGQSGGGGGGGGSQQQIVVSNTQNPWEELRGSLEQLLGPAASVRVDPVAGQVVIDAPPVVITKAKSYLTALLERATKQVKIEVSLIHFTQTSAVGGGISVGSLIDTATSGKSQVQAASTALNGNTNSGFPESDSRNLNFFWNRATDAAGEFRSNADGTPLFNSNAFINFLRTHGKVEIVSKPTVTLQTGATGRVSLLNNVSYLAETTVSVLSGGTSAAGSQVSLTPGVVKEGISLYVTPRVLPKGHVAMDLSIEISSLETIRDVSSGGQSIQTPEVSTSSITQRMLVNDGEVVLISGMTETRTNNESRVAGLGFGSGKRQQLVEALVLIKVDIQR